jgi:DNA processing protein
VKRRADERAYWAAFGRVAGVGPATFARVLEAFGSAERAWRAKRGELVEAGLDDRVVAGVLAMRETLDAGAEWTALGERGVTVITLLDTAYPGRLRETRDPPPLFYMRGALVPEDEESLAVVGTRRSTAYGRQVTSRLVREIARAGVTIVSGLARGIDTFAHRAALEVGARTIAVLGSGIDWVYPPENTGLADEIAARGAVISEFPMGTAPDAQHFPRRNRILAGMTVGTLVIEADFKSGAMITAEKAAAEGREVYAVPGPITAPSSLGPNQLIKDGARFVTSAEDVLADFSPRQLELTEQPRELDFADVRLSAVYGELGGEPKPIDALCRATRLPAGDVLTALTVLEIRGLVRALGGAMYSRA